MRRVAGVVAVVIGSAAVLSCARPSLRGPAPTGSKWINCPQYVAPDDIITITPAGGRFPGGGAVLVVPPNAVAGTVTVHMMLPKYSNPKFPVGASFDPDVTFLPGKTATLVVSLDGCGGGLANRAWLWNVGSLTRPLPRHVKGNTVESTLSHLSTYLLASSQ